MSHPDQSRAVLEELMREHDFTGDSRFRRHTLAEFLEPTDEPGVFRLSANEDPSEAITDVYEGGHGKLAANVGPGLAFVPSAGEDWRSADRKLVEVRLQDVLDQEGRVYPVSSVTTEPVFYFTLPEGSVKVREPGGEG